MQKAFSASAKFIRLSLRYLAEVDAYARLHGAMPPALLEKYAKPNAKVTLTVLESGARPVIDAVERPLAKTDELLIGTSPVEALKAKGLKATPGEVLESVDLRDLPINLELLRNHFLLENKDLVFSAPNPEGLKLAKAIEKEAPNWRIFFKYEIDNLQNMLNLGGDINDAVDVAFKNNPTECKAIKAALDQLHEYQEEFTEPTPESGHSTGTPKGKP
jgi:superfamily I DNA and/or RNA helicase